MYISFAYTCRFQWRNNQGNSLSCRKNNFFLKVKVPDGLQKSTVEKIMKAISGFPNTTKTIEILVANGKVQLKTTYQKSTNDSADSGNASDSSDKEVLSLIMIQGSELLFRSRMSTVDDEPSL